jgi:hypothetical protein
MRVQVFGNRPSPAIATIGFRKAAETSLIEYDEHVVNYVTRNFYMDDGLTSHPTTEEAVNVVKDTKDAIYVCIKNHLTNLTSWLPSQKKI